MSVVVGAPRTAFRASPGTPPVMALFALGMGLLALLGAAFHLDRLGFAVCALKAATGVPCFTCGGTRALVRLAHLDVFGALAMNPLVALGLMGLLPWGVADALLALRGRTLVLEIGPTLGRLLRLGAVPLLLANWAYLIAMGR